MKATIGEGGDWSARTHFFLKKVQEKKPVEEKPSGSRSQVPPMANHGIMLNFVFKPRPLVIGVHVDMGPEFVTGDSAREKAVFLIFC